LLLFDWNNKAENLFAFKSSENRAHTSFPGIPAGPGGPRIPGGP